MEVNIFTENENHGAYIILISGPCEGWKQNIFVSRSSCGRGLNVLRENHGTRVQNSLSHSCQIARNTRVLILHQPFLVTFSIIKLAMLLSSSWSQTRK